MFDLSVLEYEFFQRALLAGILAAVACGIIGTYVVVKRIVFISGGIAHTAFGGIGMGFYLGLSQPILGGVAFSLAAAVAMGAAGLRRRVREDSTIGILWVMGMALGALFIYKADPENMQMVSMESVLFGNIILISEIDLKLMALLIIIIVSLVVLFYKEFLALCFDEEFARISGVNTGLLYTVLLCLVALTVVLVINVVGVVLVIALLTIPATIASLFTYNMKRIMVISIILGVVFCTVGLFLSDWYDLPPGATIVLLAGGVFVSALILNRVLGRFMGRVNTAEDPSTP